MILLTLMVRERLPPRKPNDRLDLVCTYIFQIALLVFFVALAELVVVDGADTGMDDGDFFNYCSGGKVDQIRSSLEVHPDWISRTTANGEHCLHLAGIYGFSDVTKLLLENGADPNVRSTYTEGLRMHPISWNLYGGHLDNIQILVEHGADINLDFDSMDGQGKVTALDVGLQLGANEQGDERFGKIIAYLESNGGRKYSELTSPSSKEDASQDL